MFDGSALDPRQVQRSRTSGFDIRILRAKLPPSLLICCQRAFSYWAPLDVIKDFEAAKPFCFPSSSHVLILCSNLFFFENDRAGYLRDRSRAPGFFGKSALATHGLKFWLFVGACFSSLLGVNLLNLFVIWTLSGV